MKDKVVIVTGSSAGIGAATALLLADQGAKLTIHGRRPDRLKEIGDEVEKRSGHKPFSVVGDIEDQDVRNQLVEGTLAQFGRIDGLVNNAGYASIGGWEKEDLEALQKMLDVHVLAPFDLIRKCMPQLIENKGSVVNVSSIAALRGIPQVVAYCTAKAAMDGMTRAFSTDVAKTGVRINSINPGMIATEIGRYPDIQEMAEKESTDPTKLHPNGRVGQPIEVAECIAFLLSSRSSMVTGIDMPVDGGLVNAAMWK